MREFGKVIEWNDARGFGFIQPDNGSKKLFVHIRSITNCRARPAENQIVSYDRVKDKNGRPCAANVVLSGNTVSAAPRCKTFHLASALFVMAGLVAATLFKQIHIAVMALYGIMSVASFLAYSIDKSAAQKSRWRTPEATLHLFDLLGGWPGALVAQQLLRHKTRKTEFRIVFWITVILNVLFLTTGMTPQGKKWIKSQIRTIAVTHNY